MKATIITFLLGGITGSIGTLLRARVQTLISSVLTRAFDYLDGKINGKAAAIVVLCLLAFAVPAHAAPFATVTAHSVTLNWDAVVTPAGSTCVVTAYNVYRSATPGGEVIPNHLNTAGITVTTFVDNSVTAGQVLYYKVGAYGSNCGVQDGPLSDEITVTIPADPVITTPAKVINLKGIAK